MNVLTIKSVILILTIILLNACTGNIESKTNHSKAITGNTTYWVNSYRTPCSGVGSRSCLMVSKERNLTDAKWLNFYAPIEGFSFEAGQFQKIEVHKQPLDPSIIPADASSIKYNLIKVVEKKMDTRFILNDIWQVKTILGLTVENKKNSPRLEINLSQMKATGSDGCNNYIMQILELTDSQISFSPAALTRKLCQNMKIPQSYHKALRQSVNYQHHQTTLKLFDKAGNETLSFNKID